MTTHIDIAYDREGNVYTTHTFAQDGDPWRGARILLPGVIEELRRKGLLPLTDHTLTLVRSDKLDGAHLTVAVCSCGGYRSAPGPPGRAESAWMDHAKAKPDPQVHVYADDEHDDGGEAQ